VAAKLCKLPPGCSTSQRAGPHKGEPKIPKAIQSMLDHGLIEVRRNPMGRQAAFFTEAGLEALRHRLQDRHAMNPERSAHLRAGAWDGSPVRRRGLKSPPIEGNAERQ
jgi:hypothetical protein